MKIFKKIISAGVLAILLSSCSFLKPLLQSGPTVSTDNKPLTENNMEVKFLEEISTQVVYAPIIQNLDKDEDNKSNLQIISEPEKEEHSFKNDFSNFSPLLFKYSLLLNSEVEQVQNFKMFEFIEAWYGTKYCLGGVSKACIDCSAFVQLLFSTVYEMSVPRTAKEQYKSALKISKNELKEGDLIFFNTRRGISHVGVYLQNNKFVHAAVSGGVMISDLFDSYWSKRFIGVRRVEKNS